MGGVTASRTHFFCAGHRVYNQGGKCEHLHGHEYAVHFTCEAPSLNAIGMVIDFGIMKTKLCTFLDDVYDHRFLIWREDPLAETLLSLDNTVVLVPYNPTAENIALHLLEIVGPQQLEGTGVHLVKVVVDETRKCSAGAELSR